jgi:large subunit ribosomal protein L24
MYIKTGDLVEVIAGKSRSRGEKDSTVTGRVTRIDRDRSRVYVAGVKIVVRNQRPSMVNEEGQQIKKEAPIHVSNVRLYSEADGRGYRVGHRFVGQQGDLYTSRAEALSTFAEKPSRVKKVRVFLKKGGEVSLVPEPQRGEA